MTQWVDRPQAGRQRGAFGLARAWVDVLFRPRRFFAESITPGNQGPGITFAAAIVVISESARILLFDGGYPVFSGRPGASAIAWVLALAVLVVPAGIHLVGAFQTLLLMAVVDERGGIGETVQVLCYAFAPMIFAASGIVAIQGLATLWATGLVILGIARVHDVSILSTVPLAILPAGLVFGVGFGGYTSLLDGAGVIWSVIEPTIR